MTAEEIRAASNRLLTQWQSVAGKQVAPDIAINAVIAQTLAEIAAQLAELVELAKPTKIIGGPSDE